MTDRLLLEDGYWLLEEGGGALLNEAADYSDNHIRPYRGLVQSRRRFSQPQGVVGIDWGNPHAKDLRAWSASQRFFTPELYSPSLFSGASISAGSIKIPSGGYVETNGDKVGALGGIFSITLAFRTGASLTSQYLIASSRNDAAYRSLRLAIPSSTSIEYLLADSSGYWVGDTRTVPTLSVNTDYVITITHDNSAAGTPKQIYINRVLVSSGTGIASPVSDITLAGKAAGIVMRFGKEAAIAATTGIDIYGYFNHGRALSAAEIPSFHSNVWQLFAPIRNNHALALTPTKHVATPRQTRMLGTSSGARATVALVGMEKKSWTKQPQGVVKPSEWAINRGIVWLFYGQMHESVADTPGRLNGAASFKPIAGGMAVNTPSGSASYFAATPSTSLYDIRQEFTVIWAGQVDSYTQYGKYVCTPWNQSTHVIPYEAIELRQGNTVGDGITLAFASTTSSVQSTVASGLSATGATFIAGARKSEAATFLTNTGTYQSNGFVTTDVVWPSSRNDVFIHNRNAVDTIEKTIGRCSLGAIFSKALTLEEMWIVRNEPGVLFAPRKSPIWTPYP